MTKRLGWAIIPYQPTSYFCFASSKLFLLKKCLSIFICYNKLFKLDHQNILYHSCKEMPYLSHYMSINFDICSMLWKMWEILKSISCKHTSSLARNQFIIPLKKGIMLLTQPLGLSVCLSVCLCVCVCVCVCQHDCDKMAGLSSMVLHKGITYDTGSAL